MNAKAFAPGNVSCIFRIVENADKAKRHSLGVGYTVDKGVIVKVSKAKKTQVFANGKRIRFPTVKTVIRKLTSKHVKVEITDQLPSGMGFGISGASALATAYAVNKLCGLGKSRKELAMVAHKAEVSCGTGLGDVGGQYNGGFNMKIKSGKPLSVVNLEISNKTIYYAYFGKIETKKVINNSFKKVRINKAGDRALKRIRLLKKKGLKDIIRISRDFAQESGLLRNKKVKKLIKEIENKGGNASMIMLGNSVFSDIPFKGAKRLRISGRKAGLI
jgi:pantoate kinase